MLIVFWFLCGIFASVVAGNKGHNGCMWALGGFLLGPLALLATLGLGDRQAQSKQDALLEETRRQNEWMRRKAWEAEQERRYYEEQRYRRQMRQLPPEEYYEEDADDELYEDDEYYEGYDDEYVDVEVKNNTDEPAQDDTDKYPNDTNAVRDS